MIIARAETARENHKIINAESCYDTGSYFPLFEEMLSNTNEIEKLNHEIDKVIDKIFILDTKILNDKESGYRRDIPLEMQTDKEVTIEKYHYFGSACFYNDYLVNVDDNQVKYLNLSSYHGLLCAMAIIEEENHRIISAWRVCNLYPNLNKKFGKHKKRFPFSKTRKQIVKRLREIGIKDMEALNDKESEYRFEIPLHLQTDKEITIEEYHKYGDKCFYKNREDYVEV